MCGSERTDAMHGVRTSEVQPLPRCLELLLTNLTSFALSRAAALASSSSHDHTDTMPSIDRDSLSMCLGMMTSHERARVSQVCHAWKKAAATAVAWKHANYTFPDALVTRLALPEHRHAVVRRLVLEDSLHGLVKWGRFHTNPEARKACLERFSGVRDLTLNADALAQAFEHADHGAYLMPRADTDRGRFLFPEIHCLRIVKWNRSTATIHSDLAKAKLTELRELELSMPVDYDFIPVLSSYTHLHTFKTTRATGEVCAALFKLPQLHTLAIDALSTILKVPLPANLTTLSLGIQSIATVPMSVFTLAKHLQRVQLKVSFVQEQFIDLLQHFASLEGLLEFGAQFTSKSEDSGEWSWSQIRDSIVRANRSQLVLAAVWMLSPVVIQQFQLERDPDHLSPSPPSYPEECLSQPSLRSVYLPHSLPAFELLALLPENSMKLRTLEVRVRKGVNVREMWRMIGKQTHLRQLTIGLALAEPTHGRVTLDDGIEAILHCRELRYLSVSTDLTTKSLETFRQLPSLSHLHTDFPSSVSHLPLMFTAPSLREWRFAEGICQSLNSLLEEVGPLLHAHPQITLQCGGKLRFDSEVIRRRKLMDFSSQQSESTSTSAASLRNIRQAFSCVVQ